ncbi:MAG: insulinase family protein [Planctomycetes bacterium]|nr:insulinase family protein [Planctomycetota bacterium]
MWFGLLFAALFQAFDQPRIVRLDSGLRIVIVEDRSAPAVSVQLWYRAGSSLDDPANPGLCQVARALLEHRDGLAARVRAAGGRFESLTLPDAAYFATTLPPELLDTVLSLEAERMRPIDESQIDVTVAISDAARRPDASVMRRSLRSAFGDDGDMPHSFDAILAAAFAEHPYRRSPDFVSASLSGLTADTLADFLNRWFVPGNATLFIIGNVAALPTEELVRRRFAQLKWREPPRRPEAARPPKVAVQLEVRSRAPTGIDFAWVTLPWGYFENAAIDTLMHHLCHPVDGPLAARLRDAGLPAPRFARFAWYQHGLLVLSLDVPPDRRSEAERIIREALQAAQSKLPTPVQLNRAVTAARRRVVLSQTTFHRRALQLASHEMVGGDMLLAAMESLRFERVGAGDLPIAASMLSRMRRIVVDRATGAPPHSERMAPSAAERLTGAQGLVLLNDRTEESARPAIGRGPEIALWSSQRLNERLTVAFRSIPSSRSAIVRTTLAVRLDRPFPAVHALMEGSAACDADCLRDYLSYHGIEMIPFSDGGRHGLSASGPSSRIPQMIELQATLLQNSNQSEPALRAALAMARSERALLMADPSALADHLADQARASLPPRLPPLDVPLDELQEMLARLRDAPNARVEVTGSFDRDQILGDLRRLWPAAGRTRVLEPMNSANEPEPAAVTISWRPENTAEAHLRVIVHGVAPSDQQTDLDTVCRLIGPPIEEMANIDARGRWLWRCRAIGASTLLASAQSSTMIAEDLRAILRRLRAIREGAIPRWQLRLASNLARADRFTVEPRDLPVLDSDAPPAGGDWRISIIIVGGDEALATALKNLGVLRRLDAR